MCISNARPVRLTGPMKVYKVLILAVDADGGEHPHSPYRTGTIWEMGKRNTIPPADGGLTHLMKDAYDNMSTVEEIQGGAFHSFAERGAAEALANSLRENMDYMFSLYAIPAPERRIVVTECVVPEDSAYVFEGDFDVPVATLSNGKALALPRRSVASSDLIPVGILEEHKENGGIVMSEMERKLLESVRESLAVGGTGKNGTP